MRQRTALVVAMGLTAFMLVIGFGVVARLAIAPSPDPNVETAPVATVQPEATDSAEQRAAAYEQQLQTANAQLEQANRQLQEAYQRLTSQPGIPITVTVEATAVPFAVAPEQAALLAAAAVPGAVPVGTPELVDFEGAPAYAVRFAGGTVYVDANTGQVVYNELAASVPAPSSETNGAAPVAPHISADQAIAAARAYAGNGTVERVRLEEEHGQLVYEVRFTDNSRVYVDPVSGRVIYARLEGDEDKGGSDD